GEDRGAGAGRRDHGDRRHLHPPQLRSLERGAGAFEAPGAGMALQEEGRHRRPHRAAGLHHAPDRQPLAVGRRGRTLRCRRLEAVGGTDMKTRWSILLVALLGVSCTTQNKNSALVVSKLVLGTATTDPGPPPVTSCAYDPGSVEFSFAQINPAANNGGTMGVVVGDGLLDTSTLNPQLRTKSATLHPPHAAPPSD